MGYKHPPELRQKALQMFREGSSTNKVAETLEISFSTASRWQDDMGLGHMREGNKSCNRKRPAPDDLLEQVQIHGSLQRLVRHYRSSDEVVRRWLKEQNITLRTLAPKDAKIPVPDDWHEAANLTRTEIRRRWNLSPKVMDRLLEETGVIPRKAQRYDLMNVMGKARRTQVQAGLSMIQHAANHLRRKGFSNVHRADLILRENHKTTWGSAHGLPNGGEDFYYVSGHGPMPTEAMVALAAKHGWSAQW